MKSIKEEINRLLLAAQEECDYGGAEDSDGILYNGNVDWEELITNINNIINKQESKLQAISAVIDIGSAQSFNDAIDRLQYIKTILEKE